MLPQCHCLLIAKNAVGTQIIQKWGWSTPDLSFLWWNWQLLTCAFCFGRFVWFKLGMVILNCCVHNLISNSMCSLRFKFKLTSWRGLLLKALEGGGPSLARCGRCVRHIQFVFPASVTSGFGSLDFLLVAIMHYTGTNKLLKYSSFLSDYSVFLRKWRCDQSSCVSFLFLFNKLFLGNLSSDLKTEISCYRNSRCVAVMVNFISRRAVYVS